MQVEQPVLCPAVILAWAIGMPAVTLIVVVWAPVQAALLAGRTNKALVGREEFSQAVLRSVAGIEKKRSILQGLEKEVVARHEVGMIESARWPVGLTVLWSTDVSLLGLSRGVGPWVCDVCSKCTSAAGTRG